MAAARRGFLGRDRPCIRPLLDARREREGRRQGRTLRLRRRRGIPLQRREARPQHGGAQERVRARRHRTHRSGLSHVHLPPRRIEGAGSRREGRADADPRPVRHRYGLLRPSARFRPRVDEGTLTRLCDRRTHPLAQGSHLRHKPQLSLRLVKDRLADLGLSRTL